MSDIIVKFKPVGHKALIEAIRQLDIATGKAGKTGGIFNTRNKRNAKTMGMFGNTLSTVRSKLLLWNFAMAMGLKQMIDLTKQSAKLKAMEKAFDNLSGGSGKATIAMKKLRIATNGTMSSMNLFKQANAAMVLGVTKNSDEMAEMFRMAKRLGRALGVDTERSIESLVTGLGRQSVKMLDNIGIIVKSNDAYEKYAKANNKVASSLTDTEKRQAFFNAALESARSKMQDLGPETKSAQDSFDRFGATMQDLGMAAGGIITPHITGMLDTFSDWVDGLNAGPMETLVKSLSDSGIAVEKFSSLMDEMAKEEARKELREISHDSMTLLDNLKSLSNEDKAIKFIEEFGGELKNVDHSSLVAATEALQDISSRIILPKFVRELTGLGSSFDDMSGKVIDFSTINETQLLNALDESKDALEQLGIEADKETKALGGVTDKTKDNIMVETNRLAMIRELTKAYADYITQLNITLGITDKEDKKHGDKVEIFKAEIIALDEKVLLEQALKLNKEALIALAAEDLKTAEEKAKADQKAVGLLKQQISLESQLRGLKNDTIDAHLKAANAIATFAKKGLQLTGESAKQMANIEAVMAVINAIGAGLKILNSDMMYKFPIATGAYAAATTAAGLAQAAIIKKEASKFEQGGYVGGRPHSQGGTIIEAERGEFVMSRNAVESIGLETLSMMNEGGGGSVNVTVTGNVMTQDFVEGELAESIKEAVRRGSDFGIS